MIRTQLYLPEEIIWELKLVAQRLDNSVAEIVRKALVKGIPQIEEKGQKNLDAIVGMVKSDKAPRDLSENLDQYLFGKK